MLSLAIVTTLLLPPGSFELVDDIDGPPGEPGYPEGIVIVPRFSGGYTHDVYVTEGAAFDLMGETPRVTHYGADLLDGSVDELDFCELPTAFGGISGIARFHNGDLLVLDVLGGGVRLDPSDCSTESFIAPFGDLPSCEVAPAPCSPAPAFLDLPALPNDVVFAPLGVHGFVSDSLQGVVWRTDFDGGEPEPWLTAPELFIPFEGPTPPGFPPAFGPNGVRIAGGDLYIVVTYPISRIWRLPWTTEAPNSDDLELVFEYEPSVGADNLAVALSGRLYVSLAEANAISVIDDGDEIARYGSADLDGPAGVAFWGTKLLGVNHAILSPPDVANFGVFSMTTNDVGRPLWVSFAP